MYVEGLFTPYLSDRPPVLNSFEIEAGKYLANQAYKTFAPSSVKSVAKNVYMAYKRYGAPRRSRKVTFKKASRTSYGRRSSYPAQRATVAVRQPRAEIKQYIKNNAVTGPLTTGGIIGACCTVPQDGSLYAREGTVIRGIDLRYTGIITKNLGMDAIQVRIIFFMWNQGFTSPGPLSVLNDPNIQSLYNQKDARSYKILSDKIYNINSQTLDVTGGAMQYQEFYTGSFKVSFTQVYTTVDGFSADRNIYGIVIGSSTEGSVSLNTAFRFYDQ